MDCQWLNVNFQIRIKNASFRVDGEILLKVS